MKFKEVPAVNVSSILGLKIGPMAAMPRIWKGERGIEGRGIWKLASWWVAVIVESSSM